MNDRFKFRAWDIQDKVFCYFDELTFFTGYSESRILDGIPRYVGKLYSRGNDFYKEGKTTRPIYESNLEKDRYIIQQWTGLKDKDGVDVYEGDIIESNWATDCKYRGKVTFEFGAFVLETKGGGTLQDFYYTCKHGIVIGNIFENK